MFVSVCVHESLKRNALFCISVDRKLLEKAVNEIAILPMHKVTLAGTFLITSWLEIVPKGTG